MVESLKGQAVGAERQIWKVRAVKSYPEAHNHVFIGKVIEEHTAYVQLRSRTFHYGRVVNGPKDIHVGELTDRLIPWARIEVVNTLPDDFDYQVANVQLAEGNIVVSDGKHSSVLTSVGVANQ